MFRKLSFMLICVVLLTTFAKGQSWQFKLDSVISIIEKQNMFDGQVLIAEHGQVVFHEAYGQTGNGQNITSKTPLSIQSITKAFTAQAILMLHSQGELDINDPLIKYLPKLNYPDVKLVNLLNMTSGLPRFLPTVIASGDTSNQLMNNDIINLVADHMPTADLPGTRFQYNSDNYLVLASIIEQVSGLPYPEFLEEHILKPLDLDNTQTGPSDKWNHDGHHSQFYSPYGEGNMYSTAEDLYIFVQSLTQNQLISRQLIKQQFTPTILNDSSRINYGYAWRIIEHNGAVETYIVGDGVNVRASIQHWPETDNTLIYIHNVSGSNWKGVYNMVKNIWQGVPFDIPIQRSVYQIDRDDLKLYVGQYLTKNFGLLHVTLDNGKLFLRPDPIPDKEEMVPASPTSFYFANQSVEWEFYLNEEGDVIGLGIKGQPAMMGPKQ